MAPELLLDETDRERLPKADVFSLALTLYECATLAEMPKNSGDSQLYEALRTGEGAAPGLERRSKEFQHLFKVSLMLNGIIPFLCCCSAKNDDHSVLWSSSKLCTFYYSSSSTTASSIT